MSLLKEFDKIYICWHNSQSKRKPYSYEVSKMREKKIRLAAAEDVREFVRAAEGCDFDVDISYNRFIVDAKSILGGQNREFENLLQKFAIA